MKTSQQIRQEFIDFFVKKHGHTFVPSSPVVPLDDPTLLFTNAGMNQFKPIFLGQEKRSYTRAANTQKCIRAGGKHNDLDDVGRSRRHHTFFEMLGNWSFGDYFKRGAIEMSWELLTKVWGLDPTRLHVSCFEGDEKNGVPRDEEAANIWREVANWEQYGRKSDEHIHYFGKDNFWEMGDTGPCGPCTEIYIDRTPHKTGGKHVNGEDPRVMEIWNNVFIQYNRNADRSLVTLPAQHVDTGMGFERITQVLQNVGDNYAIDLFNPFWEKLTALSGIKYGGTYPVSNVADPAAEAASPGLRHDIAFRVIADHVRCLTFALTDGAVPSNEGRGYVLRRILRRAVRFGRQQLELKEPFLHTLVPVVVEAMGGAFPELKKNPGRVSEIIADEEKSFARTLDAGILHLEFAVAEDAGRTYANAKHLRGPSLRRLNGDRFDVQVEFHDESGLIQGSFTGSELLQTLRRENLPIPSVSGAAAFKLHDTHGFPIDLTQIMSAEKGLVVDVSGFEQLMEEQKRRSRAGIHGDESTVESIPPKELSDFADLGVGATNDIAKYSSAPIEARILGFWDGKKIVFHAIKDDASDVALFLDKTNFYGEMGGQIGDTGVLQTDDGSIFDVNRTKQIGSYVLHIGRVRAGAFNVGDVVTATVSPQRNFTQKNHTTTHLANWALREVLGNDVQQKGSLVDPEKLRFDFSHGKAVTDEELGKVETLVNQGIEKKLPVYAEEAPQELALKINGLRAVFGEKYPPRVRVVSIGAPVAELLKDPANEKWRQYSIEFCGGTHLANSGDAQTFAIIAEESVSKGIRRIVALTGEAALAAGSSANQIASAVAEAQAIAPDRIPATIAAIQKQLTSLTLPLRAKRKAQAAIGELQAKYKTWEKSNKSQQGGEAGVDVIEAASKLLAAASDLGGGKVIVGEIPGVSDDHLRRAIDSLKKRATSHGILLASSIDGKVTFIAAVSDDLVNKGLKAGDWVRETSKVAGGSGGGRPQMAQAGGKDPAKIGEALEMAKKFAAGALAAKG